MEQKSKKLLLVALLATMVVGFATIYYSSVQVHIIADQIQPIECPVGYPNEPRWRGEADPPPEYEVLFMNYLITKSCEEFYAKLIP